VALSDRTLDGTVWAGISDAAVASLERQDCLSSQQPHYQLRGNGRSAFHLLGVEPDIPVAPTIAGLRSGRDEAIRYFPAGNPLIENSPC
jgi:hypothetical protein